MIDVVGNDGPAAGDLVANEFRRHIIGNRGTERVPAALGLLGQPGAADILADGDIFHLGRNDALPGVGELGDRRPVARPERLAAGAVEQRNRTGLAQRQPIVLGADVAALIGFDVAAPLDPGLAQRIEALADVGDDGRIAIGARCVIDRQGGLAAAGGQVDLALGDADVGMERAADVNLARGRQGTGGDREMLRGMGIGHGNPPSAVDSGI